MNTTHYFIHLSYCTATKNKLQNDVRDYLKSLDGKLVTAEESVTAQEKIVEHIEALNKKHSKCTPLKVSFWNHIDGRPLSLSGFVAVTFHLRPATLTHVSSLTPTTV